MDTNYNPLPSQTSARKKYLFVIGFFVLATITGASLIFIMLGLQNKSGTDTRSRASQSGVSELKVSADTQNQRQFEVIMDNSGQTADTKFTRFTIRASFEVASEKVLGTTTDFQAAGREYKLFEQQYKNNPKNKKERKSTNPTFTKFKEFEAKRRLATPTPLSPCWSTVIVRNDTLAWPNSCQGNSGAGCVAREVRLTSDESNSYRSWIGMGRPGDGTCGSASPKPSTAPLVATPTPTPVPTPIATPKAVEILRTDAIHIESTLTEFITFSAPIIEFSPDKKSFTLTLSGTVKNPSDPRIQERLHSQLALARVVYLPKEILTPRIVSQSVKGIRTVAPGIEIELTSPSPTPVEATSSAQIDPTARP